MDILQSHCVDKAKPLVGPPFFNLTFLWSQSEYQIQRSTVFHMYCSDCCLLYSLHLLCIIFYLSGKPNFSRQGYPTTFFCKITVRRSKYCLEISKAREKPKISDNRSIHLKYLEVSNSLTMIFGGCVIHILIPRYCDYCQKKSP